MTRLDWALDVIAVCDRAIRRKALTLARQAVDGDMMRGWRPTPHAARRWYWLRLDGMTIAL